MCKLLSNSIVIFIFFSSSILANETNQKKATVSLDKPNVKLLNPSVNVLETTSLHTINITPIAKDIEYYQALIETLEVEGGVYGSDISQHLVSLGLLYQKKRKFDESIDTFKRAIHLNRINEGLYSANQLKILDYLINSYSALHKWEEVNQKYQYYFWLNLRNYGEDDPQMLTAILKLARWHLKAYSINLEKVSGQHLLAAYQLFEHARKLTEKNYGNSDYRLVKPLQGIMVCNYFFATYNSPAEEKNLNERFDTLNLDISINQSNITRNIATSYKRGRDAHMQMINVLMANKATPPLQAAKAMLSLGDWYLLFDKRRTAFNAYQEAYGYLMENNIDVNTIETLFGKPVVLPQLAMLNHGIVHEEDFAKIGESQNYVLVSFDVTNNGKTRNVEILESNPVDNTYMRAKILRSLRKSIVRPKMIAGTPTASENTRLGFLID